MVGDALSELTRLDERIRPTTASAIIATVGKGNDFARGHQFCAWSDLVPGQHNSGGKQRLERIIKTDECPFSSRKTTE